MRATSFMARVEREMRWFGNRVNLPVKMARSGHMGSEVDDVTLTWTWNGKIEPCDVTKSKTPWCV